MNECILLDAFFWVSVNPRAAWIRYEDSQHPLLETPSSLNLYLHAHAAGIVVVLGGFTPLVRKNKEQRQEKNDVDLVWNESICEHGTDPIWRKMFLNADCYICNCDFIKTFYMVNFCSQEPLYNLRI